MSKFFLATTMLVFGFGIARAENGPPPATSTLTHEELASQIQEKAKQLEGVTKELETTRATLRNTKDERLTLQRELNSLDGNITQLNLNLKADEIQTQKLSLEIESLHYELGDIENTIEDKRGAVEKLLLQLHIHERLYGNLLRVFLTSKSLADGMFQTQTYKNLEQRLVEDISSLKNLHADYGAKISLSNTKRDEVNFHRKNLENRKAIVEDQKEERQTVLVQTKNKESVFARQVAELEKLQEQIANEVEALDAILRTKIDPATLPPLRPGILLIPIEDGKRVITQGYGATNFAKVTYKGKWHNGIDIGVPVGTPVMAAEDGVTAAIGNNDLYCPRAAYGKFIVVKHNNNLATLYAHLSRQIVQIGQQVKRGEVIGYVGKTGWATGPHLHFVVFAGPTFYMRPTKSCGQMPQGGDINPLGYL